MVPAKGRFRQKRTSLFGRARSRRIHHVDAPAQLDGVAIAAEGEMTRAACLPTGRFSLKQQESLFLCAGFEIHFPHFAE